MTRKQQRVEDVENAQPLVIDRGHPVVERLDPGPALDLRTSGMAIASDDMAVSQLPRLPERLPCSGRARPDPRRSVSWPASTTRA